MSVKVTFIYEPDEPEDADPSGMSQTEFERLMDQLIQLGGDDIQFERI